MDIRQIKKESLYIVMPAYNEEENIRAVVDQWYPILENKSEESRLVIADKGSTDATHDVLMELKKSGYDKLEVIDTIYKYHGPKLIVLYKYAIAHGADYIFQTDSDGQTDAKEFENFWELRTKYDLILGNRTSRGDGKDRAFVEHVVCFLLRCIFGIKVPDANAPFRLMRARVVGKYLDMLPETYNLPNIMLTTFFAHYQEQMIFKEISFKPRQGGVNSINIPRIIKIGWNAIGDFYRFKRVMRS